MNKIKLELTKREFDAITQMIEDNSIMIGFFDEEFAIKTKENIKIFNDALKKNGINYSIKY